MNQIRFGLIATQGEIEPYSSIFAWREQGATVWELRGQKMRTHDALFDEVAAVLQFPSYFGENWAAFDECLCDIDWWPSYPASMAIVIRDADEVLARDKRNLETFARILARSVDEHAAPISRGAWWDRGPIPMPVVLSTNDSAKTEKRWTAAGASLKRLA